MVDSPWNEDQVRKVWSGLSGDNKYILREIVRQNIFDKLSSLNSQINLNGYQKLPYPVTSTKSGYKLDPVWQHTILKINRERNQLLDELGI